MPACPGAPQMIDSTKTTITLSWAKPTYDGGSPITEYQIEAAIAGSFDFVPVQSTTRRIANEECIMPNLKMDSTYKYK